jgi:DNA-binding transcriptional MerR regulator
VSWKEIAAEAAPTLPKGTGILLYDEKDVQRVGVLYRLIRVEGLSIEGAKRKLKEKDMTGDEARQEVIQRLQALRQQLLGIIGELEMESNQVI